MAHPTKTDCEAFLVACLAHCLLWEIAVNGSGEIRAAIREWAADPERMPERLRWTVELYEEAPPTAQEERSVLARIERLAARPRDVLRVRDEVLALLPEALRESAVGHSMMRALRVPEGYGGLRTWILDRKGPLARAPAPASAPLAEREAAFERFLGQPRFPESFRAFWHQPPKYRGNRRTRVLVTLAAALSQMIPVEAQDDLRDWMMRLGMICRFSAQTRADLTELIRDMGGYTYDPSELAYFYLVDEQDIDKRNLLAFINEYGDQFYEFTREFEKGVRLGGVS